MANEVYKLPYVHVSDCKGCNSCCGEPCPTDVLQPIGCIPACPDNLCFAPNLDLPAGTLIGLTSERKAVPWGAEFGFTSEFIGFTQLKTVTDGNGNVISRKIMNTFAPQCTGCLSPVWLSGMFEERSVSPLSKQVLEDAIAEGHVRRKNGKITLW